MRFLLLAVAIMGCGGSMPSDPDMGTHCGNGDVYCSADETCISGDCVPACVFADGGCPMTQVVVKIDPMRQAMAAVVMLTAGCADRALMSTPDAAPAALSAQEVFETRCVQCHTERSNAVADAAFDIHTADDSRAAVKSFLVGGDPVHPYKPASLTPDEWSALSTWADQ